MCFFWTLPPELVAVVMRRLGEGHHPAEREPHIVPQLMWLGGVSSLDLLSHVSPTPPPPFPGMRRLTVTLSARMHARQWRAPLRGALYGNVLLGRIM